MMSTCNAEVESLVSTYMTSAMVLSLAFLFFSCDGSTVHLCKDVNHWTYVALVDKAPYICCGSYFLIGICFFSDRYIYICRFMELYIRVQTSLLLLICFVRRCSYFVVTVGGFSFCFLAVVFTYVFVMAL